MLKLLALRLGSLIIYAGIALAVGNETGIYPTFPFAGMITIVAGAALMGLGGVNAQA